MFGNTLLLQIMLMLNLQLKREPIMPQCCVYVCDKLSEQQHISFVSWTNILSNTGIHQCIVINVKDDTMQSSYKKHIKTIGSRVQEKQQCMKGKQLEQHTQAEHRPILNSASKAFLLLLQQQNGGRDLEYRQTHDVCLG